MATHMQCKANPVIDPFFYRTCHGSIGVASMAYAPFSFSFARILLLADYVDNLIAVPYRISIHRLRGTRSIDRYTRCNAIWHSCYLLLIPCAGHVTGGTQIELKEGVPLITHNHARRAVLHDKHGEDRIEEKPPVRVNLSSISAAMHGVVLSSQ
jgi:hypothetical protein